MDSDLQMTILLNLINRVVFYSFLFLKLALFSFVIFISLTPIWAPIHLTNLMTIINPRRKLTHSHLPNLITIIIHLLNHPLKLDPWIIHRRFLFPLLISCPPHSTSLLLLFLRHYPNLILLMSFINFPNFMSFLLKFFPNFRLLLFF